MAYFQSNSILTCIFANREWHHYALERKPLRVSTPAGLQRSSYSISMPWRFGIPLMASMSFLHWTLSQSIFILPLQSIRIDGTIDDSSGQNWVVFSVWPLIVCKYLYLLLYTRHPIWKQATRLPETALITGFFLTVTLLLAGIPRFRGGIPMGATCSAVISAACHRPLDDKEAYKFPVQWGAVSRQIDRDEMEITDSKVLPGHCCFTTARDVERPRVGEVYM
jgi:hypothetical protein